MTPGIGNRESGVGSREPQAPGVIFLELAAIEHRRSITDLATASLLRSQLIVAGFQSGTCLITRVRSDSQLPRGTNKRLSSARLNVWELRALGARLRPEPASGLCTMAGSIDGLTGATGRDSL